MLIKAVCKMTSGHHSTKLQFLKSNIIKSQIIIVCIQINALLTVKLQRIPELTMEFVMQTKLCICLLQKQMLSKYEYLAHSKIDSYLKSTTPTVYNSFPGLLV